jgi:hypothetical protein
MLCLDVVLQVCFSLSPSWREPFLRSAPLVQGVVLDQLVIASTNVFYSLAFTQNSVIEFKTQNCNKIYLLEHFIYLILICDVLCIITSVITSHSDHG